MQMAFKRAGVTNPLVTVCDGQQAIDYLAGTGPYANRDLHPIPCVVLLDLNLPRRSGFEVLQWIREHPHLKSLPVLIVTSSGHEHDLTRARDLGANDYIMKQADLPRLAHVVQTFRERWLPPRQAN